MNIIEKVTINLKMKWGVLQQFSNFQEDLNFNFGCTPEPVYPLEYTLELVWLTFAL